MMCDFGNVNIYNFTQILTFVWLKHLSSVYLLRYQLSSGSTVFLRK